MVTGTRSCLRLFETVKHKQGVSSEGRRRRRKTRRRKTRRRERAEPHQ